MDDVGGHGKLPLGLTDVWLGQGLDGDERDQTETRAITPFRLELSLYPYSAPNMVRSFPLAGKMPNSMKQR